jgi:hypothetical protein
MLHEYSDETYNPLIHSKKEENTLDHEVYARFSELIGISKEYILEYAYDEGKNGCARDKETIILLRALAVILAFSGRRHGEVQHIASLFTSRGINARTLNKYINAFRKQILKEYNKKVITNRNI